jgi:hypothetical protein
LSSKFDPSGFAKDIFTSEIIAMKVFLTDATGYLGSAIAEAASHAAEVPGQTHHLLEFSKSTTSFRLATPRTCTV